MKTVHQDMGKLADYYDWLYEDWKDDIEMYDRLAHGKKKLLECGVGTGRVAIPLAKRGYFVSGFDHSADMIRVARKKLSIEAPATRRRAKFIKDDMRSFNLKTIFEFIYIPLESFNHLLTLQDQVESLENIRRHLNQDGLLVMDLFSPKHFQKWMSLNEELKWRSINTDTATGKLFVQTRYTTFDVSTQLIQQYRMFDIYGNNGEFLERKLVEWQCRIFFRGELELLLEKAGFQLINIYGDYNFQKYDDASDVMVCVAKPY